MKLYSIILSSLIVGSLLFCSCKDNDAPVPPDEEEIITRVRLIFSADGEAPIVVLAEDPDGEGPAEIEIETEIVLQSNTIYDLFIELENTIAGEDITAEVEEEGDEHQFFFSFTEDLFENPTGNGNMDMPEAGSVDYQDEDVNGLPLGLITRWGTGTAKTGAFRIVLKHQPDIKTSTTTAVDGESDIDLEWDIVID